MSGNTGPDRAWRDTLVQALNRVFCSANEPYGVEHALNVERAVQDVLKEPEYRTEWTGDEGVLIAGALLHDVGFASKRPRWSDDWVEHLDEGARLAPQMIAQNAEFEGQPQRVEAILQLVAGHDDTAYAFPSKGRGGCPIVRKGRAPADHISCEMPVLAEADGLVHAQAAEMEAAVEVWQEQGLPYFAEHGPPLNSWMWNECIAGNIRLTGKRGVLDAHTDGGRCRALEAYDRLEELIRKRSESLGVLYQPEVSPPRSRRECASRMLGRSFQLEILRFHGWDSLEEELRRCTLLFDTNLLAYEGADLRSEAVEITALTPLALYVLKERLDEVEELHDAMMVEYCLGLWDLPGWIEFRYDSDVVQSVGPPIVEEYTEKDTDIHTDVAGLVDGLHRCVAAQRTGVERIQVVVASRVRYPLVPLPATWEEVRELVKRRYRYDSLKDFPDVSGYSAVQIDESNCRYFFYRDWRKLGSRGRRTFHEFDDFRAN